MWNKILQYIGLPLAEKLVAFIISYFKTQYKKYKNRQERKAKEKEAKAKGKKYEESGSQDDFNRLP